MHAPCFPLAVPPAVDRSHGRRARQRRVAGRAADNALHEAPHGSAGSRFLRPQLPFHSAVSTEIFRIHRWMALAGDGRGMLMQPSAWQAHADLGRRRPQSSRYPLLCVVPPFSVCSRLQPLAICQVANSGVLLRGGGDGCPMRAGARMKAALRRRAATGVAAASLLVPLPVSADRLCPAGRLSGSGGVELGGAAEPAATVSGACATH